MKLPHSSTKRLSPRQIASAAEGSAADLFTRFGFDVLEQGPRGRNSHELDAANQAGRIRVLVHGSLDGFWNLVDPYLEGGDRATPTREDYHRGIDVWAASQPPGVVWCLVSFDTASPEALDPSETPRIYLATVEEVAARLHSSTEATGDSALYESYEMTDAEGRHRLESLPEDWRFSLERVERLISAAAGRRPLEFRFSTAARCVSCATVRPAACVHCLPMMN